jgi:lipopolysaccharide biosynthesis glycosyltransferase
MLKKFFKTLRKRLVAYFKRLRNRGSEEQRQIRKLKQVVARQADILREANQLLSQLKPVDGLSLESSFSPAPLPNDGSLSFATAINDSFVAGLECLVHTLQTQHPGLSAPFHVFHDSGLSAANQTYLASIYPNFVFKPTKEDDYAGIEAHGRIGHTSYFIFEAFRLSGKGRVIALDADLLCLNPLGNLLDLPETEFAASLNVGENLVPLKQADSTNYVFNSGVMHIPARLRSEETFSELISLARKAAGMNDPVISRFADQRVLNYFFKKRPFTILSLSYNTNVKLISIHLEFSPKRIGLLHFTGPKPWTMDPKKADLHDEMRGLHQLWHKAYAEARGRNRPAYFRSSGAFQRILDLKDIHRGKRAFILGNGPSLRHQDLTRLKGEVTFAGNWFALHDQYDQISPPYYCLCSHTIFGGWDVSEPKLDENLRQLLLERTADAIKFFSFDFRDCLESSDAFPSHDLRYLLYEKPLKRFVDSAKDFNLDPSNPLHDGHTVVVTFAMLLAHWMGVREIYLLGCDCDYGIAKETDDKQYFYASNLHTTKTSAFDHLQKVWDPQGGRIFQTYDIVKSVMARQGVTIYNATHGGCLENFERRNYESLFEN